MDHMKRNAQRVSLGLASVTLILMLALGALAQTPTPSPSPKKAVETPTTSSETAEEVGNYTATGTIEIGYRGLRVGGDLNKYQSDLNYKAGPRIFDSSFLLRAKDNEAPLFETLLV